MDLVWRDTFEHAVELFGGQRPGTQLEADVVERFEQHPTAVVAAIEKLGERFRAGRVHSPWPLVLRELDSAPDRTQIRASDESDRARAVHLAERYIATLGHMLPSEAELLDELFGRHGRLHAWAGDELLRKRMLDAWLPTQALGTARTSAPHVPQTAQQSQTSVALTAVSADSDPDADIPW